MWQIGTDQGLLTKPVRLNSIVSLRESAPTWWSTSRSCAAERRLAQRARCRPASLARPRRLSTVMQFRVGTQRHHAGPDDDPRVTLPGEPVDLPASGFAATRNVTLEEVLDADGDPCGSEINGKRSRGPVGPRDEAPKAGTTEEWRFVNLSADTHPMHLHLTRFQVVDRWAFDVARYTADARRPRRGGQAEPDPMSSQVQPEALVEAWRRPGGARVEGHRAGEPRSVHAHPSEVRPAARRQRPPAVRLPLPHPRARGQRHDAAVRRAAVGVQAQHTTRAAPWGGPRHVETEWSPDPRYSPRRTVVSRRQYAAVPDLTRPAVE